MAPPPPGQYFDLGGRRLHAVLAGSRRLAPTVVLDAALGGSTLGWTLALPELARLAPVIAYDRAGMGWSDAGPIPRTLDRQAEDLRALLTAAGAVSPFVWVGHSYGALVARYCAYIFADETAGLVLVDPPELGVWAMPDAEHRERLDRGIRLARRGVWAARCGLAQATAWLVAHGALRLASASASLVSSGKFRPAREFNFAPAMYLPPHLKPAMRWVWTQPRFYATLAAQMEDLPQSCAAVAVLIPPGDLPVAVLSAADTPASQLEEHRHAAAAARRGRHWQAARSGHWIPLEDPALIVDAVRWALEASRQ